MFVHHAEGPDCYNQEDCMAQVRGIQNYHMDSNGWSDIGYRWAKFYHGKLILRDEFACEAVTSDKHLEEDDTKTTIGNNKKGWFNVEFKFLPTIVYFFFYIATLFLWFQNEFQYLFSRRTPKMVFDECQALLTTTKCALLQFYFTFVAKF